MGIQGNNFGSSSGALNSAVDTLDHQFAVPTQLGTLGVDGTFNGPLSAGAHRN